MQYQSNAIAGQARFSFGQCVNFLQVLIQLICMLAFFYLFKHIGITSFCQSYYISLTICFVLSFFFILPYLLEKNNSEEISYLSIFIHGAQYQLYELIHEPRKYLGKFWVDSITHDPLMLEYVIKMVGSKRVTLGSDYPFPLGDLEIGKFIEDSALPKTTKEDIFANAALEWLDLPKGNFE